MNKKTIVFLCLLFGYGWIFLTDGLARNLSMNLANFHHFELFKGLVFITIASIGLYGMLYLRDQRLRETRELADSILETANVGIALLDEDGIIIRMNHTYAQMFGYSKEELAGQAYTKVMSKKDAAESRENFRNLMAGKPNKQREWAAVDRKGNKIKILIDTGLLESAKGQKYMVVSVTDITDQKKNQQKLLASLNDKKVLLTEIHHRVKNNLAIVASFLQLQKFGTDNQEIIKVLTDSEMKIHSMAMIHEKLYESKSLTNIRMDAYISDLANYLKKVHSHDAIDLAIEGDQFGLNVNQAVPCALILNEVLSNSFRHAFENGEKGNIQITAKLENKDVSLSVSDNGKGLPPEFDLEGVDSYGFIIIKALVQQLKADISIKSEPNQGTKTVITFDKSNKKGSSSLLAEQRSQILN